MLTTTHKLKSAVDFNRLYRYGKRAVFPVFTLRWLSIKGQQLTRFGVVASIKQLGKANVRNRARRRLWSSLNKTLLLFPAKNYLIAFVLKKEIIKVSWPCLINIVEQAAKKVRP
ncbi:MAG: ribonuclease P protein component [Patescibacteria group bacterium]